jgi:hypothetical protein
MFAVVNTYTRASQFKDLPAENSYQLQRVGGNILGCSIDEKDVIPAKDSNGCLVFIKMRGWGLI